MSGEARESPAPRQRPQRAPRDARSPPLGRQIGQRSVAALLYRVNWCFWVDKFIEADLIIFVKVLIKVNANI